MKKFQSKTQKDLYYWVEMDEIDEDLKYWVVFSRVKDFSKTKAWHDLFVDKKDATDIAKKLADGKL